MQSAVYLHAPHMHQPNRSTGSTSVATLRGRFEQRALSDKMYKATALVFCFRTELVLRSKPGAICVHGRMRHLYRLATACLRTIMYL